MLVDFWGNFPLFYAILRYFTLLFLKIAREARKSRQKEGQGDKREVNELGGPRFPLDLSLILLAFLLALRGLPGNPSSCPYLETCFKGFIRPYKAATC